MGSGSSSSTISTRTHPNPWSAWSPTCVTWRKIWGRRTVGASCDPPRSRAAFLADPRHRLRFVYTPKHASWLNQIELGFSILVRRLLKRASFASVDQLKERVLAFIEYFNRTLAKPCKWTYTGRALVA